MFDTPAAHRTNEDAGRPRWKGNTEVNSAKKKSSVQNVVLVEIDKLECKPPYTGDTSWLEAQIKREQTTTGGIAGTGLCLPIIVRPVPNDKFHVHDGIKRVKAAPNLKLSKLPVFILDLPFSNEELAEWDINSSQRQWEDPIELAKWLAKGREIYNKANHGKKLLGHTYGFSEHAAIQFNKWERHKSTNPADWKPDDHWTQQYLRITKLDDDELELAKLSQLRQKQTELVRLAQEKDKSYRLKLLKECTKSDDNPKPADTVKFAIPRIQNKEYIVNAPTIPANAEKYSLKTGDFSMLLHDDPQIVNLHGMVRLVTGDLPWKASFYPKVAEQFGQLAQKLLEPNLGRVAIMVGQYWLEQTINILGKYLTYSWLLPVPCINDDIPLPSGNFTGNKVFLVYRPKGAKEQSVPAYNDVIYGCGRDKRFHAWGMPIGEMVQVIRKFTQPGQLVVDPVMGSGTTGIASLLLNRAFLGIDTKEEWVEISKARIANFFEQYPEGLGENFSPWWLQPKNKKKVPGDKNWSSFWVKLVGGGGQIIRTEFPLTVPPSQLSDFLKMLRNRWNGEDLQVEFYDLEGTLLITWHVDLLSQEQLDTLAATLLELAKEAHITPLVF